MNNEQSAVQKGSYSIIYNSFGFTLVELLIVLSIISILVTIAIVSFRGASVRARDTERISDIRQYQNSLEIYANGKNGLYPGHQIPVNASTTLCNDLSILGCPEDPRPSAAIVPYRYYTGGTSDAGTATAASYVMYAKLEATDDYWVACSDGRSGKIPTTIPFSPPGCPL